MAGNKDCPWGHWPGASAGPDQVTAGRSGQAGPSASRWAGWVGAARGAQGPRRLRRAPRRRKPGQVPVAALSSKRNCFSLWGRAGQGRDRPLGSRCVVSTRRRPERTPKAPSESVRPSPHAEGGLSRPRSPPTPKLLPRSPTTIPRPLEFRRLQGTPGWLESTPGSPQASSFPDVDLGLHSRPALPKKHLGCRRGVASWRSPGCHLPGHLRLRLGVTQALLAWERRQSSADRTERPLPRLSGRQTRCWGLPLLGAQRQRHQGRPARPR